ncbi:MAG: ORF6N domain-containing protein [Paludibacteraceae bacterium]|nr:ORF6N domain-containing protein [Paludibacteraceae bacterium]
MANRKDIVKQEVAVQPYSLQQSILTVRGEQVMLDFQLAKLYGVETRVLKQAVNRNIERFPGDFMFKLTKEESNSLISNGGSQTVIPSGYNFGGTNPYAFTEQGVAMLSSVLRSDTAVRVNVEIMRAFVAARRLMLQNREHELAINELRLKMQMLEDALENNLGAMNDLSEEMRAELDNIYNAIGALSMKYQESQKSEKKPVPAVGYQAIWERDHKKGKAKE